MTEETKENKIDNNKQEKLKNIAIKNTQEEELKNASIEELRSMLSNKNADYVFRLQKELETQGKLTADAAFAKIADLLPEIVIAQRKGQPANSLFNASPKVKADELLHPYVPPKETAFWQKAVDNALLMIVIFTGLYGVMGLFDTKNTTGQNGILVILVVSTLFGISMAKYNEWLDPAKGARPQVLKMILISLAFILGLVAIIWLLTLPGLSMLNPVLPGMVYLIIAVATYGIRYWFRKQYHIVGSAFSSTTTQGGQNK
ncbi:hypothetical protein FC52_GL001335 [Lactobacillus pasteurii DSM 23907 = CRBIP 24.76]|uniref:Membrane-bound protein n=1 Tax=Lactobacillus pasteurii DSM 23907 = CRBIP 24.76 TaxID=1423790 RepID=I7JX34_9LACO|nr:DUF1129 family protein [Lactobacillus pasteurii]KRK07897.1 hypothetical protein FC52_GL001335 [Lactobacillus pasteurii DSM 23907 = CRBIP 24.76]TDG77938.1 hypothetical protein C5L33_001743 [Lactobacillus pasteurii]CCI84335.1 Putative uncharacterized protein [Lactobacillus pasteurii DSM 23907 = CRBIP 24.76]